MIYPAPRIASAGDCKVENDPSQKNLFFEP